MTRGRSIVEEFERHVPEPAAATRDFWLAGADGVLKIVSCRVCGTFMHPPRPACASCGSTDVGLQAVSGRGTVKRWTLNRYPWSATIPTPYLVAEVELVEQAGLLLRTNLVDVDPRDVHIGLDVEVCFATTEDELHVPLFRPATPT